MSFETERRSSALFEELSRGLLSSGHQVQFRAHGRSMTPLIQDGETLRVEGVPAEDLHVGDIIVAKTPDGLRAHRLVSIDLSEDSFRTRADAGEETDPAVGAEQILGRVVLTPRKRLSAWMHSARKTIRDRSRTPRFLAIVAGLVLLLAMVAPLRGQVVINDVATSVAARLTNTGSFNTLTHTTANNPNLLLVVGVSMNITNNPAATVTGITYGVQNLVRLGAQNDATATRRVEIWSLTAPTPGTVTITVTGNLPVAGQGVGFAVGAMVFRGVDQTVPLSPMVSNSGTGTAFSQLDIPSGTNQMVFDTLAAASTVTITAGPSQTQQWNLASAGGQNSRGFGSTNVGSASVPMSETWTGGNSNWSVAGASVMPLQADVSVTVNPGGAVPLGQNLTYTISVTNNGPTAATNVTLTDTLAAGLTLVSATPSQGGPCTGSPTITCPLGGLASGATATVTVVASAGVSGFYANTASVTATQPDLNQGNNSYTAVGIVQSNTCATPANLGNGGTLTGVVNTYYPATASVAAGIANTSIPVGAARGGTAIAAGDLLLVIQMQDASINSANSAAYGNGFTGSGFTAINNAGNYEFVKATGPAGGGVVPIAGAGPNGGLIYGYTIAAATGVKGKSTYQVIRVPQYATATLGAGLTALPWDGTSGGVLALDIAGALTLNSVTIGVDGLGFRGAAGLQMNGGGGVNTDYVQTSPAAYAGAVVAGMDGGKGEGVAGTPRWLEVGGTFFDTTVDGYPNGGIARGAPGNAGGGGTDGHPSGNDENSGGGGGGNGGTGGWGGDSWNSALGVGGLGGAPFPSTVNRIALGGGGGGGSRNNSDGDNLASSAAAGGGIIFIRAGSLTGTATLTANGAAAYNTPTNDAGGGGGAGGTVVVLSAGGGEGGLTIQAHGGRGGNADSNIAFALNQRHGPGGGGGGGAVYLTGAATIDVAGGANGLTLNTPAVAYGATSGTAGVAVTNAQDNSGAGTQSGAGCIPDVTIAKTHIGNLVRGASFTYQILVSNVSPFGSTNGAVIKNDTLPLGVVPTSAIGTGWACSIAAQTVSCVRSDVLAAGNTYPVIAITAAVTQTAPAAVTNIATVGGGGEINLLNDIATDPAAVSSSADLVMSNTGSPNPVAAGSNITYTQTVTNSGPSDATAVTFTENIPANTTAVSVTPPAGWTCSGGTTIVCSVPELTAGSVAQFTVVVRVNPGTPNGTVISDTASVSSAIADPNAANNTATANIVVGATAQADLSVSNVASPNPVTPTSNITYVQVVTNTGSAAATTATFSEAIPVNTTFQSLVSPAGWTCATPAVGSGGNINCTNPSVAAGSVGNFQLQVKVNVGVASGTVITDTVTVGATNDANVGNNTATATDLVATAIQADLALTTTTSPSGQVLAGGNLGYTQTITNNGPATASTVSFTEATPANTTFRSVLAPAGWTCATPAVGGTGNVTCTNPSLLVGSVANILVTVNVNANTANGSNITATSTVSAATGDPNGANNTTTTNTLVNAAVNLTVTNSGTPSPVLANANITYTQTVTNSGPSNAATVAFTQATPANTTFQSIVPPAGWTCTTPAVGGTGNINCTIATFAPATTANLQVVVHVNAGTAAGTIITDTVTATTTTRDTLPGDNTATVNIGVDVNTQADVRVTNSGTPDPVTAGNNITYTQVATNGGPANALTVVFSGATPANTTFVSMAVPAGWACPTLPAVGANGAISCNIATLASGASGTFTLVVKVNTNTAFGTLITDSDQIISVTGDPNNGNNSATSIIAVGTSADLSITNAGSPNPVQAGNNITYTQVLTNPGPSNAANVTFTEVIPTNTNFRSLTFPAGWSCATPAIGATGTVTCTIASLAPGVSNFSLVVQVNAGTAAGTTITDTVTASSATDTNNANNTATVNTTVATAAQADLAMTNTPGAPTVNAGSNITYTQTVTNNGPAAASTLTFTETIPPNTTFVSVAGGLWGCVTPGVGSTGTVSCTLATLAAGASAPISLVVQVNASTPSGTVIGDTPSTASATSDPNLANNSATATVTVGTGTSADLAITKSAAPSPVAQGILLTYTLNVTNNGPAVATNVTVVDTLPSSLSFIAVTTNTGTCSQASNTVTCQLGSMANAATAAINIVTIPQSATIITNTATVSADQTDPTPANNAASASTLITAVTRISLQSLTAEAGTQGIVLRWQTGGEIHNLGFNIYREQSGERIRLNPTLVAGSALMMRSQIEQHAGKSYAWIDPAGTPASVYWLEDLDLNGERTLHGPVSPSLTASSARASASPLLSEIAAAQAESQSRSHVVESAPPRRTAVTSPQMQKQFQLAAHPAIKIMVDHEGWYRVTQPELVAAGLNPNIDPRRLQLFAEAIEQPILVSGANPGFGGFGPNAAIEFYGTGLDTTFTGTRVYWLMAGNLPGLRIRTSGDLPGNAGYPQQFAEKVELRDRTTYFAALITPDDNNFFGALVSTSPVDQVLQTPHILTTAGWTPRMLVVLRGVGEGVPHDVAVALNGVSLGNISFTGQVRAQLRVDLPPGLLQEGANTVTLTAQDGDSDISLVDYIDITYPHSFVADHDQLKFSLRAGEPVMIAGFQSTSIRVFDITNAAQPVELATRITSQSGSTTMQAQVPFWPAGRHTLLALADDNIAKPAQLVSNQPSHWNNPQPGSKVVVITHPAFADALAPLVALRRQQGRTVSVVSIDDVYDEFSFGEHSPQSIRDFLATATKNWKTAPSYLLLAGDASVDPRNFLGFGDFDFVPTRIIPTSQLMTASDDWFSDFNNTGLPALSTGRLPVRTAEEANTVVAKIVGYETGNDSGAWTRQALVVADRNDADDFTSDSQAVAALLPPTLQVSNVFATNLDPGTARADVLNALNSGELLVNYMGHGSVEVWSGENLLNSTAAAALTNAPRLPVFLVIDCLNGFFHDVYTQSLAETLLLNSQGGAVAVVASSGLTDATPQAHLDRSLVQALFQKDATLGDALVRAKSTINSQDVRRTYVLFGDPLLRLKAPAPQN